MNLKAKLKHSKVKKNASLKILKKKLSEYCDIMYPRGSHWYLHKVIISNAIFEEACH